MQQAMYLPCRGSHLHYLVVAATTYLSPKRGLEATYQAQKGALSRVLHGSELHLHHRAERAKKRFP